MRMLLKVSRVSSRSNIDSVRSSTDSKKEIINATRGTFHYSFGSFEMSHEKDGSALPPTQFMAMMGGNPGQGGWAPNQGYYPPGNVGGNHIIVCPLSGQFLEDLDVFSKMVPLSANSGSFLRVPLWPTAPKELCSPGRWQDTKMEGRTDV